jgi:hypothetical protein
MRITISLLGRLGACSEQRRIFKRVFPGGANLTPANVELAVAAGLSLAWLARQFFDYGVAGHVTEEQTLRFEAKREAARVRLAGDFGAVTTVASLGVSPRSASRLYRVAERNYARRIGLALVEVLKA